MSANEIRLFAKCRNESARLGAFFDHYRGLGVDRFFIVDNDSTDGSLEYLESQPDVRVFRNAGSMRAAHAGMDWLNPLLSAYGVGGWCVTADFDEFLVFSGSETVAIRTLTAYLDEHGFQALACLTLDLYPPEPLPEQVYATARDLIAASPYFDVGPYESVQTALAPVPLIRGGMRERVFFPEHRSRGSMADIHEGLRRRVAERLPWLYRIPWLRRRNMPPLLTKVPLVKWDEATRYLNDHWTTPRILAPDWGVLLHFKFLGDFHARASREVVRGEYYNHAAEYRQYARTFDRKPDIRFLYEGSMRYESTAQLVDMGLVQESEEWRSIVKQARPEGTFDR